MDLIWGQAQRRSAAAHWHDGQITPRGEEPVKGLSRACCHSGAREARTTMCNCTSENLEIPGLVLRTIPE